MRKYWFGPGVLALGFLSCICLALGCDWDQFVNETHSLDPVALSALKLGKPVQLDPESCRNACCAKSDCDLASVGPEDQCVLVNCWLQGRDQCAFQARNDSQVKVYRKKVDPKTRAAASGGGETPHIVPLGLDPSGYSVCRQPMKVGACRAAFPMFFYNVTEQRCSSFTYGGCDGNGNRFSSQEECERNCSGVTGEPLLDVPAPAPNEAPFKVARRAPLLDSEFCGVEPEPGPCRAAFPRWFYNHNTGSCEAFIYGGCGGNKNNYESKESCSAACTVSVLPSAKKPSPHDMSAKVKEFCGVEPEPGPCRAAFPRWFYNHNTGSCEEFIYGGCGGNKNNYESKESCSAACTGSFDQHGEDHNERTAAFFLFITLAVISALLLVALIVVSVRRRRLSLRLSSVSDKQELLPEDKHSSLESLSIPDSPTQNQA